MAAQKANILAQRPRRLRLTRALALALAAVCVPALTIVTAFGIAPGTVPQDAQVHVVKESVPVPGLAPEAVPEARYVTQERVLRGDTVAALFDRLGIGDPRALEWLKADSRGRQIFRQLVPGRTLQAETGASRELLALRYFTGPTSLIEVSRNAEGTLSSRQRAVADVPRLVYKTATIRSSLFAATDAAGIPDAVAMQVARIFATDIDFHSDLRKGDTFSVVYEMVYESGELVAPGRIVAARFVNDGRTYDAVLFHDEDGHDTYYSLDGSNLAKAFLRSPVEFSRISSGFGMRVHPIAKTWIAHKGTDYAAATGTRVRATADGTVEFAGVKGGYGNVVVLRHYGSYKTVYAHLSRFPGNVRRGVHVAQGDTIGYVGQTGWATGPHLHYEFQVGGQARNPRTLALPSAHPVPAAQMAEFQSQAAALTAQLDLPANANLATAE